VLWCACSRICSDPLIRMLTRSLCPLPHKVRSNFQIVFQTSSCAFRVSSSVRSIAHRSRASNLLILSIGCDKATQSFRRTFEASTNLKDERESSDSRTRKSPEYVEYHALGWTFLQYMAEKINYWPSKYSTRRVGKELQSAAEAVIADATARQDK
jgi:hypothetical protein